MNKTVNKDRYVILPGQTPEGEYILSALVKRSYDIVPDGVCVRAASDTGLNAGDVYYDGPVNSSVRFEADSVPYKLMTDIVLNGSAFAPGGEPAESVTASVEVGGVAKRIRVTGDRFCRHRPKGDPFFTDPEPFTEMEIRYERAYGGVDVRSDPDTPFPYPRNHVGKGFAIGCGKSVVDNLPLPNIEDPEDILTPERISAGNIGDWEKQPVPAGFGWISKYWYPRALLAGVMPADRPWETELLKTLDSGQTGLPGMDFQFFNGAPPGLALPFQAGDEEVLLTNLVPEGVMRFRLPGERPKIGLDIGSGVSEPPAVLHTVAILADERRADMVWRAAVAYPGPNWLPEMKKMEIFVE